MGSSARLHARIPVGVNRNRNEIPLYRVIENTFKCQDRNIGSGGVNWHRILSTNQGSLNVPVLGSDHPPQGT